MYKQRERERERERGEGRGRGRETGGERLSLHFCSCPKIVENFCVHASNGYYNGHVFHRVIKQFMIQTGDPTGEDCPTALTYQHVGVHVDINYLYIIIIIFVAQV